MEWVQWTHPLVSGMGVQRQACLAKAVNPELWYSVPVLLLNTGQGGSCCQLLYIRQQVEKATQHHSDQIPQHDF